MGFYLLLVPLALPIGAIAWRLATRGRRDGAALAPRALSSDGGLIGRFAGPPFETGVNRRAQVVRQGTYRDHPFVAFHYSYDQPERRNQLTTMTFTVVAVQTPAPCPGLAITRPTLQSVGDLELESEQFNEAFLVQTADKKFAYDVLHPGMMAWLLDDGRALRMPLRFGNQDLFTYAVGVVGQEAVTAMLDYLCDVLDRVPTFVWKP